MTLMNLAGLGLYVIVVIVGTMIKRKTHRRVKALNGMRGVTDREEMKHGCMVGRFEGERSFPNKIH